MPNRCHFRFPYSALMFMLMQCLETEVCVVDVGQTVFQLGQGLLAINAASLNCITGPNVSAWVADRRSFQDCNLTQLSVSRKSSLEHQVLVPSLSAWNLYKPSPTMQNVPCTSTRGWASHKSEGRKFDPICFPPGFC